MRVEFNIQSRPQCHTGNPNKIVMVIILTNQLDQGTHNIRDLLSSEIDFPKTFSHVVDIEISKCHLPVRAIP